MDLVANGPGLGDAVVLTCVLAELARQRPDERVTVRAEYGELFVGWPNVERVERWPGPDARPFAMLDSMQGRTEHQVATMCRALGLSSPRPIDIRPEVRCTGAGGAVPPFVALAPMPGPWARATKAWSRARWEALAVDLRERGMNPTHVGTADEDRLVGAVGGLLGAPILDAARLLAQARVVVTTVSGAMHLATAVGTRVVALFGGREDPAVTGYMTNTNLIGHPPAGCAPCWALDCAHDRACLADISVAQVVSAVVEAWSTFGS